MISEAKRKFYETSPSPLDKEAFNKFLVDNNEVISTSDKWIVIKNKFIENQLVAFYTKTDVCYSDIGEVFKMFPDKYIYRNDSDNRSLKDRFHLHIKL